MELRVKEETGHQECRPGAPVAAGPHLAPRRGRATCRAWRPDGATPPAEPAHVRVCSSVIWERLFSPPLGMFFFHLRE